MCDSTNVYVNASKKSFVITNATRLSGSRLSRHTSLLRPLTRAGPRGTRLLLGHAIHGHTQGVPLPSRQPLGQHGHRPHGASSRPSWRLHQAGVHTAERGSQEQHRWWVIYKMTMCHISWITQAFFLTNLQLVSRHHWRSCLCDTCTINMINFK